MPTWMIWDCQRRPEVYEPQYLYEYDQPVQPEDEDNEPTLEFY